MSVEHQTAILALLLVLLQVRFEPRLRRNNRRLQVFSIRNRWRSPGPKKRRRG